MKTLHFQTEVKSVERVAEGVKIRGFASTPDIDRQNDIVLPMAFKRSLDQYIKDGISPALLRSHNSDRPVGRILMDGDDAPVISEAGLTITALVTEKETAEQVENGEMQTFSIGYIPARYGAKYEMRGTGRYSQEFGEELKMEVRIIHDLDWLETSIVTTPANPKAIFSLAKSIKSYFDSFPSTLMKKPCDFCANKSPSCGMIGQKSICSDCINKMEFKGDAAEKVEKGATMHAVIFSKEKFDKDAALKVCTEKGFKSDLLTETDEAFVFGQSEEKIAADQLEVSTSEIEGLSFLMVKAVEVKKTEEEEEEEKKKKAQEEEEEKKKKEEEEAKKKEEEKSTETPAGTVETPAEKQDGGEPEEGKPEDGEAGEKVVVSPEQKETIEYLAKVFGEVSAKTIVKTEEKKIEVKTDDLSKSSSLDVMLPLLSMIAQKLASHASAIAEMQGLMQKMPAPRGKGMVAFQHSITMTERKEAQPQGVKIMDVFNKARSGEKVVIGSDE